MVKALDASGPDGTLSSMLTGMGSLSYGELAGERIQLGLMLHDPEEEHDCFSDNTHWSHYYDAQGIENMFSGSYERLDGSVLEGPGLKDLLEKQDPALANELGAALGNGLFRKVWVSAPSSTQASDGLGPLFNARACQQCHIKDGRGHPPQGLEPTLSMLMKTVVLNASTGKPEHDQFYGERIQNFSVAGVAAEADVEIEHEPVEVRINAGEGKTETITLSKPIYSLRMARPQIEPATEPTAQAATVGQADSDPEHAPDHERRVLGPRVAPQMIGLGLLQSIHEGDLEALEDPDDLDGDGISGRVHRLAAPTAEDNFGVSA